MSKAKGTLNYTGGQPPDLSQSVREMRREIEEIDCEIAQWKPLSEKEIEDGKAEYRQMIISQLAIAKQQQTYIENLQVTVRLLNERMEKLEDMLSQRVDARKQNLDTLN